MVIRRKLTRGRVLGFFEKLPRCVVGIEACSSSHYWARELIALGHDVRLLPAQYVKPYLKRQKNDAADAEAICEAVTRPTMRFVPVKSPEQQSVMMLHRVRLMLNRQINQRRKSNMRGGARKGPGRPRGAATKRTRTIADRKSRKGITPLEVMLTAMREHAKKKDWDPAASRQRRRAVHACQTGIGSAHRPRRRPDPDRRPDETEW